MQSLFPVLTFFPSGRPVSELHLHMLAVTGTSRSGTVSVAPPYSTVVSVLLNNRAQGGCAVTFRFISGLMHKVEYYTTSLEHCLLSP